MCSIKLAVSGFLSREILYCQVVAYQHFIADRLPQIYYAFDRLNINTGAFEQLTRKYMEEEFNPNTPDVEDFRLVSTALD